MPNDNPKPDLAKFLTDPEFQTDRDLINGTIDARLQFHAEEAEKRRQANAPVNIFDYIFGGVRNAPPKK